MVKITIKKADIAENKEEEGEEEDEVEDEEEESVDEENQDEETGSGSEEVIFFSYLKSLLGFMGLLSDIPFGPTPPPPLIGERGWGVQKAFI